MPKHLAVIYVDDCFAYRRFRNTFGQPILTPNLDAFAAGATVFDSAYALVPTCGPSRAATMTGWSPFSSAVMTNNNMSWKDYIPVRDNLSAVIRRNGAYVSWAGKIMHGYGTQAPEVQRQIHDSVMQNGTFTPSVEGNGTVYYESSFGLRGTDTGDEKYYDARVAQWGIDRIADLPTDRDTALFLGFQHPHTGYAAPKRFYEMYDPSLITKPTTWAGGDFPRPTEFSESFMSDGTIWPDKDFASWQQHVRGYLACISHVDYEIGRVLNALNASPRAADTTVIFISDHGYHVGDHDIWGKFTLFESAARTPLMVRWAGQTTGNVVTEDVSLMDVYPTALDAMGYAIPDRIQGQSLRPHIPGQTGTYESRGALTSVYGSTSIAWGNGRYRFTRYPTGDQELFDHVADPGEGTNLIDTQPALAADGRARLVIESARYDLYHVAEDLPQIHEARNYALFQGATVRGGSADDNFVVTPDTATGILGDDGGHDTVYIAGWTEANNSYTLPDWAEDVKVAVKRDKVSAVVHGNEKDNLIFGSQVSFEAHGGGGNDTMLGATGAFLYGDAGDDEIQTGGGNGGAWGGDGNDTLTGGNGITLSGDAGDDYINITNGGGVGLGGSGDDTLDGSGDDDTLNGGTGDDVLNGGSGNDLLIGGPGSDTMDGGTGDDTLQSLGDDVMTGGSGTDTFIIGRAGTAQITDWEAGETIDITSWAATPQYRQLTDHSVLVWAGSKGVYVNGAAQITIAQVQEAIVI